MTTPPFDVNTALNSSRLNPLEKVEMPPTIISINGRSCMTAGSSSMVIGKAKSRKGFLLGAIAATAASGSCSIEGMHGNWINGRKDVMIFDTEQGAYWGHVAFKRIIKAIGCDNPANLQYFNLQQFTPVQRLKMIDEAIMKHKSLLLVIIDGIRDLISSINDENQATEMASNVLRWCSQKQIHIVNVLHQNKADLNARGHIGTELINKSETVFSVTKERSDETISTVNQEFSRDMNIPSFSFMVGEDGLPYRSDQVEAAQGRKKSQMGENLSFLFKRNRALSYRQLCEEYCEISGLSIPTAKRHLSEATKNLLLKKDHTGVYRLNLTFSDDENDPF